MSKDTSPAFPAGRAGEGPLLIVVSGPSGVGKDAVLDRLRERGFTGHIAVTATTRPPRESTVEVDPHLSILSVQDFDRLLAEDGLLEHAQVYGHRYGVPKQPVKEALERGQDVVVRVDIQGAASIKALAPAAVLVFLAPPSLDELEERIRSRGLDDEPTIRRRLGKASEELARTPGFDYVVVNERDRLDEAVDRLLAIMAAERCRVGRRAPKL